MDSRTVLFDEELFECVSYFNVDAQENGVDVYYLNNNFHIGQMEGIELPDEEDAESVEQFECAVCLWLTTQDVNYTLE